MMILTLMYFFSSQFVAGSDAHEQRMEQMIEQSEKRAIVQLKRLIVKKPNDPQLLLRLAELYSRRSKSRRFFEFQNSQKNLVQKASGSHSKKFIKLSIQTYEKIEQFDDFEQLDFVLFNSAFLDQQLSNFARAKRKYSKLIHKFPKSNHFVNAQLALGEIAYDQQKFSSALRHYKVVMQYPNSQVYPYAIYKTAWTYYNQQNASTGIKYLEKLILAKSENDNGFSLRQESLRDIVLFYGDVHSAQSAYAYFKKLTNEQELADVLVNLAKLYDAHGRHKDMVVFLREFIEENPHSDWVAQIHETLFNTYQILKKPKKMFESLKELHASCQTVLSVDCRARTSRLAKIMIKDSTKAKKTKLASHQIDHLFAILFINEINKKELSDAHLVYAGILYEAKRFESSAIHYIVSSYISTDLKRRESGLFSSIAGMYNHHQGAWTNETAQEYRRHIDRYLSEFPDSTRRGDVNYRIGYIFYELKNHEAAKTYLSQVEIDSKEFYNKSVDLRLDILNEKKKYREIITLANEELSKPIAKERKSYFQSLIIQSEFAFLKTQPEAQRQTLLVEFSKKYKETKLAKAALLEAIQFAKKQNQLTKSAEICGLFVEIYPQSEKTPEVIKEAIYSYEQLGQLEKTIPFLQLLIARENNYQNKLKYLSAAIHYSVLTKNSSNIIPLLAKLNYPVDPTLNAYLNTNDNNTKMKLSKILSSHPEVFSEKLYEKSKEFFAQKKYADSFRTAAKVVGSKTSDEWKAKARHLQAQILSTEYYNQSVKTRADRFALVLSIKSDKFEKAQKSLRAVSRWADINLNAKALDQIITLNRDFRDTIQNLPLPREMDPAEFDEIKQQLQPLVASLDEQHAQLQFQMKDLIANHPITDWTLIKKYVVKQSSPAEIHAPRVVSLYEEESL